MGVRSPAPQRANLTDVDKQANISRRIQAKIVGGHARCIRRRGKPAPRADGPHRHQVGESVRRRIHGQLSKSVGNILSPHGGIPLSPEFISRHRRDRPA